MMDNIFRFTVEAESQGEGDRLAADLKNMLEDAAEGISVRREKADQHTLELGTIITILINSPFALAAVKAIKAWLLKHPEGELSYEVEEKEGRKIIRLKAKGLTDEQLERAVSMALRRDE